MFGKPLQIRWVAVTAALTLVGGLYALFAPGLQPAAADDTTLSYAAQQGKAVYDNSCISCHGANLQGVEGRGPSLIGVGSAAVEFQVGTGRMPMTRQEAQAERKKPRYSEHQIIALAAYVHLFGGGPEIVTDPDGSIAQGSLRGASGEARADTAMIVHLNEDRDGATLVSIPRDTLVPRPACQRPDGTTAPPAPTAPTAGRHR